MAQFRPIYSQDQGIQMRGLALQRVCLNRHLPLVDRITAHSHPHSQLLLYLTGSGAQQIGARTHGIDRGSLFFIPPGVSHSFTDGGRRKPMCLALDLQIGKDIGSAHVEPAQCVLSLSDLKRVRQELALLTRWHDGHVEVEPREAAAALRLIDLCFRALGFLKSNAVPAGNHLVKRVQRALADPASWSQPLAVIARGVGYQPDHLNRLLKPACGLTLGEFRDTMRLRATRRLLTDAIPIAEVASIIGFEDPNYFSRWFRHQTGVTPSAWRTQPAAVSTKVRH